MAHVNNGTKNDLADNLLPALYTKPVVVTFSDFEYRQRALEFTVAKSGVENADEPTTVTALVAAVNTAYAALVAGEYDIVGNTITSFAVIRIITTNQVTNKDIWNDTVNNYLCIVDIYVKIT